MSCPQMTDISGYEDGISRSVIASELNPRVSMQAKSMKYFKIHNSQFNK